MLIDEATTVDADEHERIMGIIEAEGIAPTFPIPDDFALKSRSNRPMMTTMDQWVRA